MESIEDKASVPQTPLIQNLEKMNTHENIAESEKIAEELVKQLFLAAPMISVSLLHFSLQLISVMFVVHLGESTLSAASLATTFASVTGFSLLMGIGSALDTMCGQSYRAKQYHMLEIYLQTAMFAVLLVSIPLAMIWANMCLVLAALGQDPKISRLAGTYARFMIYSFLGFGILQCHNLKTN